MKYFKKLLGEKIYLSPRNSADYEIFTKWLNDFETTDYIGRSANLMTIDAEKEFLQKSINENQAFAIVQLENDKLIGTISLEKIDYINRTAVLGIFIGEKEEINKGYGQEAINLILDYGFNYLNLNNIKLDVLDFNKRAIACYEKCGFKEYGKRRKSTFINGKYYDRISMDILKEEFTKSYIKNKNI